VVGLSALWGWKYYWVGLDQADYQAWRLNGCLLEGASNR
jgi:hypothetical protein